MFDAVRRGDPQAERRFFFFWVLPFQSVLLTAFVAPMYGFNALIQPLNQIFSPEDPASGWAGATAGGAIFLTMSLSGLVSPTLQRWTRTPRVYLIVLHLLFAVFISMGALAIWLDWYWLVLGGFTIPIGVMIGCLFSAMMQYLLVWARKLDLAGIQSGAAGLMFGVWGAIFSVMAPLVVARFGLEWTLVGSGVLVLAIGLLARMAFFTPHEGEVADTSKALPVLSFRELLASKTYWVFLVFSTLFLIPGFGFKVIVQALAVSVFHVTQFEASMVAFAFLSTYGLSRLICGFLADRFPLKPMYLIFAGGQSLALLVAAIGLPLYPNVVFLTVLMCVVGSLFAGGKSLWSMVMMSLFGQPSYPHVMAVAMPAFGIAGMAGPITLNAALRSSSPLEATSVWFYVMAAALLVCVGLFASLRHFDFDAIEKNPSRASVASRGGIEWF